jgi:hypothetical protein
MVDEMLSAYREIGSDSVSSKVTEVDRPAETIPMQGLEHQYQRSRPLQWVANKLLSWVSRP